MINYPDIIFDAERMKNPHTGIFHYCKQLGDALLLQQHLHQHQLGFYLPPSISRAFQNDTYTLKQRAVHKILMPSLRDYKVWHCTNQQSSYFPVRSKNKIALTIHDLNFLYEKSSLDKQQKYLDVLQKKVERADTIIAISKFVKNEIESQLKVDQKKITVIYNGCNIPKIVNPIKPVYPINFPFIFSLGTVAPKKNFHVLPSAIVHNNMHLVIAGALHNKQYLQKIKNEAARLGVRNRVHYIGTITEDEKYWLMQQCSLFAFPSLAEGFGLPVIEAMRFGKPVLLSAATSLPEVGGSLPVYLKSFDTDHISEQADFAISDFTEEKMKETIKWSQQFSWENAATNYWSVYEQLCDA